jgi:predicted metal-binding membrane protein
MEIPGDRERLQRLVMGASLAAWLALAALQWQAARRLPDALCSAATASFLNADWMVSTSLSWLLMATAMMLPLTLPAVAHIRRSALTRRRTGATALFLLAFLGQWLLAGLLLEGGMRALRDPAATRGDAVGPGVLAVAAAALAVAVWHASPAYQRLLNRCHAHRPLAVFGGRAHADAVMTGVRYAGRCIVMCGPLMFLTLLLPHWHLAAMIVAALLITSARLDPPGPPVWRLRGLGGLFRWCRWTFFKTSRSPWRIPTTPPIRRQR